jgi:hypothetical protein
VLPWGRQDEKTKNKRRLKNGADAWVLLLWMDSSSNLFEHTIKQKEAEICNNLMGL